MDIEIPRKIAESFGLDENSIVELTEKPCNPTLDRLLASIPEESRRCTRFCWKRTRW